MFPYPSGAGLHVGHIEGYIATDIISRYLRMKGYEVLHPMGWDAFGLPAENYALKTGIHPRISTEQNIKKLRQEKGISQDKLSKLADISLNTVVKIELDQSPNPTLETIQKLAKALGVSLDDLVNK